MTVSVTLAVTVPAVPLAPPATIVVETEVPVVEHDSGTSMCIELDMVSTNVGIVTVPATPEGASAEEDVGFAASLPAGPDTDTVSVSLGTVSVPTLLKTTVAEGVAGAESIAVPSLLAGIPLAPIQ